MPYQTEPPDISLASTEKGGRIGPITIRGAPNIPSVEIPEEMLKTMCQNIDAAFE
jgi:hypothetical protein